MLRDSQQIEECIEQRHGGLLRVPKDHLDHGGSGEASTTSRSTAPASMVPPHVPCSHLRLERMKHAAPVSS